MMTPLRTLPLFLLGACSVLPQPPRIQPTLKDPAARVSARPSFQAEREWTLWQDPAFRQRFTESFLSETEVEPTVTTIELPRLEEVRDLFFDERFDRALELLQRGNSETASAVFDFYIGNIHVQREEFAEAEAAYLAAVNKYPKFLRAWRGLGLVRARSDNFAGAVTALTKVLQLGGNDVDTYGGLGIAYSTLGNHIGAESAFRMATLLEPGNLEFQQALARAVFDQKRYAEAASIFGYLIDQNPANAQLWLLQASAYIGMKQPMSAAENLEMVERLGGSTADGLFNLGDIYINEGLFDLGVEAYTRALTDFSGGGARRPILAAQHLARSGAVEETRQLLAMVREHRGGGLEVEQRKNMLKLEVRLASLEGAGEAETDALRKIVDLDPLDGDAILKLGKLYELQGDSEQAILLYERAAMIEVFEAPAKVAHARLLVRAKRYADAIPLLKAAQVVDPKDSVGSFLEEVERAAK